MASPAGQERRSSRLSPLPDYGRAVEPAPTGRDPIRPAPRRRRPRKSTEDLKTELLSAATTVFARRGYSGGSTKEIAELAATTQASIYRHYGSKADLFVAAVAEPFLELID